jgi:REP element-mobilizing transposase RayT
VAPKAPDPTAQGNALGIEIHPPEPSKARRAVTRLEAPHCFPNAGGNAVPQSLSNVLLHLAFSTKHRQPLLRAPHLRDVMTGYLIGTLRNMRCPSLIVGVVEDHVHILCNLHRTVAIAKLVEEVKTSSSVRIKQEGPSLSGFHWQNGYGVFSVSQSNAEQVKSYIANQDEHHRKRTFQEEFRLLLERHAVQYDERYIWD